MFKVVICVLTVLFVLGISGCARQPAGVPGVPSSMNPARQKLKVWIEFSDNPKLFQDAFARYAQENNLQVEVVCPAPQDKILAALSSSDAPDIIVLGDYLVAQSIANRGLTLDLRELGQEAGIDFTDTYPAALAACQQDDRLACLPWGADTMALFWNKDLFEQAGLDPEQPPRTLEALAEYADRLTKWDDRGNLVQVGFLPDYPWPAQDLMVSLFGGSYYADNGHTLTVNSPANLRAYQWTQQFYTRYGPRPVNDLKSGFGVYASSQNGFFADKVAMVIDGEWLPGPNFLPKFAPEMYFGVAPLPVPAERLDAYGSGTVAGSVVVVPTATHNRAAAARLLAWMESPAVVAEVMSQNANLPSSKQAAQDPRFGQLRHFQVFVDILSHPQSTGPFSSPIHQELADALARAGEQIWQLGADPTQLLNDIQREYEPRLAEAWRRSR